MNEHMERLLSMRDDEGLTWDLSGKDRAAFAWAIKRIDELTEALLSGWPEYVLDEAEREEQLTALGLIEPHEVTEQMVEECQNYSCCCYPRSTCYRLSANAEASLRRYESRRGSRTGVLKA